MNRLIVVAAMTACVCATTGDLVVENGTVEVENKVTFPNMPNVRGDGWSAEAGRESVQCGGDREFR